MIPKHNPIHPGEILREEFLEPLKIPQTKLAEQLDIPLQRVNEICTGKRGITAETAWLLSAAFKNTPHFWMNLQTMYDLARAREQIEHLPRPLKTATR
jgi:addiction module HigA family antidote